MRSTVPSFIAFDKVLASLSQFFGFFLYFHSFLAILLRIVYKSLEFHSLFFIRLLSPNLLLIDLDLIIIISGDSLMTFAVFSLGTQAPPPCKPPVLATLKVFSSM